MSRRRTPVEIEEQIVAGLEAKKPWATIAQEAGVSSSVIHRVRQAMAQPQAVPDGQTVVTNLGEQSGTLDVKVAHEKGKPPRWLDIKNPEELLKICNIDPTLWTVDRCRVSSSEVTMKLRIAVSRVRKDTPKTFTNVHVSIQLRKRAVGETAMARLVDRLIAGPYKPKPVSHPRVRRDSVMLEWCPYDQHHGMLAWGPEVNEHYDLRISERFFTEACHKVISTASPYNIGQIVVPIGQDWFHANDPTNTTPGAKHHLDVEGRLIKIFETGYRAVFHAIEQLRQVAPVHILWVPGNHDPETSYYLVRALAAHYMELDGSFKRRVTVDFSPRSRKVYTWGNSVIGFSHPVGKGSWEKQRGIFSEVFKKEWAAADHHEIHTGHLHKVMEYGFMQADTLGSHTVIRMLPSLCAIDRWHFEMGFVEKNRASSSFIWSKNEGLVCQFTTRVKDNCG